MERIRIYFKPIWYNIIHHKAYARILCVRDDVDIRVYHDIVASGIRDIV